jgi:hypothetical protein
MFAPAYMGAEKDGAKPLPTLLLRGQEDYGEEQESSRME